MSARQVMIAAVFVGLLMGCAATQEPATSPSVENPELAILRQHVKVLQSQMEVERSNANSFKAQISSLEGRLRGMQDILMAKDEEIGRLEAEIKKMKTKKRSANTS